MTSHPTSKHGSAVWWQNPLFVFPSMVIPLALATYRTPEELYVLEWRCRKYFVWQDLVQVFVIVAIFCTVGAVVQLITRRQDADAIDGSEALGPISVCFDIGVVLTLLGYLIWTAVAVGRGFRPSLLKGILALDGGTIYQVKMVYFKTIPGVTTATQFGMGCALVGTWLAEKTGSRTVKWKVCLLVALAALRSLFLAERLALIELALPCVLLKCHFILSRCGEHDLRRRIVALFPIVAIPFLLVFFSVNEYFRSWGTWYQYQTQMTLLEFSTVRLVGYYITAINNATVYHRVLGVLAAPKFAFDWLWNFPGIGLFADMNAVVQTDTQYGYALTQFANPEMNNVSGLLTPLLDFGSRGAILYWVLVAVVASVLYSSFQQSRPAGLLLYPFFYVGLMEIARAPYWTTSRAFPTWMLLALSLFLVIDGRVRSVAVAKGLLATEPLFSD